MDATRPCARGADNNLLPARPYPWGNQNPVTVAVDGINGSQNSQYNRYLLDVVPQETDPEAFHPAAMQAQAIAARSYAYWHWYYSQPLNNSNAKQVFVPFRYDAMNKPWGDFRAMVDAAVQDRYYMSQSANDNPIFAEFSADAYLRTLSGDFAYLTAVEDPISSHPDIPGIVAQTGAHQRGMSQDGASRWARGNLSYNINTDLGAWSVSWPDRYQILTHYYTGIYVRDANGNILTPPWRGNVLQVNWSRPKGYPDGICSRIEVRLQNTGATTWYSANGGYWDSKVGLGYCWNGGSCVPAGFLPRTVEPGGDLWVTLLVPPWSGSGELQIDLYWQAGNSSITWFPNWPRQGIGAFSAVPNYCTRLPLMQRREPER